MNLMNLIGNKLIDQMIGELKPNFISNVIIIESESLSRKFLSQNKKMCFSPNIALNIQFDSNQRVIGREKRETGIQKEFLINPII